MEKKIIGIVNAKILAIIKVFFLVSGEFCHLTLLFRLTVILQWILLFAVLFGVAIVFNPSGKSRLSNHYASDSEFNSYLRCLKLVIFS